MESKIFIDSDAEGRPQIRIDYKNTGDGSDVRDKLLARFLFDVMYSGQGKVIDVSLEHGHDDASGTVAFIRLKSNKTWTRDCPDCGATLEINVDSGEFKCLKHNV